MENYEKWLIIYLPSLSKRVTALKGIDITQDNIAEAFYLCTYHVNQYEWLLSILDISISENEIFEIVKDFDFSILKGIEFSNELFPENIFLEKKAAIKVKNRRWVIHKNDADYFPSKPHAHLIEEGVSLDLFTGDLYKGRRYVSTLPKAEFSLIRKGFIEKGFNLE